MIHLTTRLVVADLRAAPWRAVAVAMLLVVACLLPSALSVSATTGSVLAFTVAFAATAGVIARQERRAAVLAANGGQRGTEVVLGAASMVVPGLAAAAVASVAGAWLAPGPSATSIAVIAVGVPMLSAPIAVWTVHRADPATALGSRRPGHRFLRWAAFALLVVLVGLVSPLLVVGLVALRLMTSSRRVPPAGRPRRLREAIGVALSVVILLVATLAAGRSRSWVDLWGVLVVLGPGVVIAVALLGTAMLDAIGALAARIGPRARLAVSPLSTRGRSLGPAVGILAVVLCLAVVEATVGASFGRREEHRERTLPTITAPAGASADEAIVSVPPVEVDELRRVASEATAGTGTRAVVVEQLGVGTTGTSALFGDAFRDGAVRLEDAGDDQRPRWLGVVDRDDLVLLGMEAVATDLDAGRIVVRDPGMLDADGRVTITSPQGRFSMAAVAGSGPTEGTELPAALVAPDVASELTDHLLPARVVVVPEPGRPVDRESLRQIAATIGSRASVLPPAALTGLSADEALAFDLQRTLAATSPPPVRLGDEPVVLFESGPLNDVPILSGSGADGRERLLGLGALASLMTVAIVVLGIGATREEDEVLRVQGAPARLRSAVGGVQAALLAGAASLLAAAVGVGVPAVAFRIYNAGSDLPDIPLVVPVEVAAQLVALPLVAAGLTALFVLRRHPTGGAGAAPADDLVLAAPH